MRKLLFLVISLFLDLKIEGRQLMRPGINSVEEQICLKDYQITMLEHTNKYRSLYGLKPLQVSKKLQYVALLAVQKCHVFNSTDKNTVLKNMDKIADSLKLLNTGFQASFEGNLSINKCKAHAVDMASNWYDKGYWTPLDDSFRYTYMGCAISIVDSTGYQVCYYQNDKGANKLRLNILPANINIDLESYKDSFWTQFKGNIK